MSAGYASRLSEYKDKGICGLPETMESRRGMVVKVKKLAELMEKASQVVVITGAGCSTSSGIPDFRGPQGIWTKEQETKNQEKSTSTRKRKRKPAPLQRKVPDQLEDFTLAKPTVCHRAITKLASMGEIKYVITQNVDGLHRRAGLSRDMHSSVHGCVFTEKCEKCGAEFFRDFDVGGMSFQPTGRNCTLCKGVLKDTLLDWEDSLPKDDLDRAYEECETPGTLVLCLGTSLRIQPVGDLPLLASNIVIVNLQKTPHDDRADLVIRGDVDEVMDELLKHLGMTNWRNAEEGDIERVWVPAKKPEQSTETDGTNA